MFFSLVGKTCVRLFYCQAYQLEKILSKNVHFVSYVFVTKNFYVILVYTRNSLKRREKWFLAGVRMYVCVCILEISIWHFVQKRSSHDRDSPFMAIDARFTIVWDLKFFETCMGGGSSNFCKIRVIVRKVHTNILYRWRKFVIEFDQNRSKRWNFFLDFQFFANFHKTVQLGQISIYRPEILCVNVLMLWCDVWYWILWGSVETFKV